MSGTTPDDVRVVVKELLNQKLKQRGRDPLNNLSDDYDLLLSGVFDSLAFVETMAALGEHFDWEIDLAGLDPENVTVVGPLCTFVSEQLRERLR